MLRRGATKSARNGFTIVELFVTMGVICLLMALLVPGVQSVRESSRRIDCTNRMKQIVLATEAFESRYQRYPEFSSGGIDYNGGRHWNVCPFVEILPFVDRAEVYNKIDHERWFGSYDAYGSGQSYSPQNAEIVKLTIPLYQCPSDRNLAASCNYRANMGSGADWYTSHSRATGAACFDPKNGNGAFQVMKPLTPQDFTDGLSNTVIYSERVIGDGDGIRFDPWRDYSQVDDSWPHCTADELQSTCRGIAGIAAKHASYSGFSWVYASKSHTGYDHILSPNSGFPDCAHDSSAVPSASNSAIAARSQHRGAVNAAMGDGSVKTVSENVDLAVWRELGSRNGRD